MSSHDPAGGVAGELTEQAYWDAYWRDHVPDLPVQITRSSCGPHVRAILDILERWLPHDPASAVLEIGGAPGRYLSYVQKLTGGRAASLDYSPLGCELTRRNFALLNQHVSVYERDLFDAGDIGQFDAVYSLGVVEHFDDLGAMIAAHARLVKPGGILVVGMPNFRSVNGWFAKRLNMSRYLTHNVESMRLEEWDSFERALGLERLFSGPVGGFEPHVFSAVDEGLPRRRLPLAFGARVLVYVSAAAPFLRRFNHPLLSGYLMGVWRVPHLR